MVWPLPSNAMGSCCPGPLSVSEWVSQDLSGAEMSFAQTLSLRSPWKTPASPLWHELVQPGPRRSLHSLFSINLEAVADSPRPTSPRGAWRRSWLCSRLLLSAGLHLLLQLPSQIQDKGGTLGGWQGGSSQNLSGQCSWNPLIPGKSYGPFLGIMSLN